MVMILLESKQLRRRFQSSSVTVAHGCHPRFVLRVRISERLGVSGVARFQFALVPIRKARLEGLALGCVGTFPLSDGFDALAVLVDLEGGGSGLEICLVLALLSRKLLLMSSQRLVDCALVLLTLGGKSVLVLRSRFAHGGFVGTRQRRLLLGQCSGMLLDELLLPSFHRSGMLVVASTQRRDQSRAVIVVLLEREHLRRRCELRLVLGPEHVLLLLVGARSLIELGGLLVSLGLQLSLVLGDELVLACLEGSRKLVVLLFQRSLHRGRVLPLLLRLGRLDRVGECQVVLALDSVASLLVRVRQEPLRLEVSENHRPFAPLVPRARFAEDTQARRRSRHCRHGAPLQYSSARLGDRRAQRSIVIGLSGLSHGSCHTRHAGVDGPNAEAPVDAVLQPSSEDAICDRRCSPECRHAMRLIRVPHLGVGRLG